MDQEQEKIFELNYNLIISSDYESALDNFKKNHEKYPENTLFICGIVLSYILKNKITECFEYLKNEGNISKNNFLLKLLIRFFENNNLQNYLPFQLILNTGIFLKKRGFLKEARIFSDTSYLLNPSYIKTLLLIGELEIIDGRIDKGIKLIIEAVK